MLLAAYVLALALLGVQGQEDQWQYIGNAQLVTVAYGDLAELVDSNDTLVESDLPGVLGLHGRRMLQAGCGTVYANSISIAAQHYSTLTFSNTNKVGFQISQTVRVIVSQAQS